MYEWFDPEVSVFRFRIILDKQYIHTINDKIDYLSISKKIIISLMTRNLNNETLLYVSFLYIL